MFWVNVFMDLDTMDERKFNIELHATFFYNRGIHVTNKKLYIYTAVIIAFTHSGCAVYEPFADFTKQRYTNAISYFNTFYNAQRQFNEAEDEVLKARRDYLEKGAVNLTFAIPASARQKFQTSIEKNSKVLTFYSDSKWVDDALMMIGKAYFYMEDDVRAERKFQELAVQFPHSDLFFESQLWLGKSFMRQKKTEQGIKQLEDVFVKTVDLDNTIAGQSAFELAQYYFAQGDFTLAEQHYSQAVKLLKDDEIKTQLYFQIGKCFSELQQIEKAQQAYTNAADISPIYTFKFQAILQLYKSYAFEKKYDEALNGLNEMLSDTKNKEFFGIIHFEIANVLMKQGNTKEAVLKYTYVDTAFARSEEAARSYFILGKYFENKELNYDSARVLYGKARTEYAASEITKDAAERSDIFNKYDLLKKDLIRFDSLYSNAIAAKAQLDSSSVTSPQDSITVKDTLTVKEDTKAKKMTKTGKQEIKKDSIIAIDSTKIKERITRILAQKVLIDSLQRSIIRTKFELGGLFYLEIQQADSALSWFTHVVEIYPKSQFAPRALYSIAEIFRSVKKKQRSELDSLYQKIITTYPESPYANEARKNVGLPVIVAEKDSAQDLFEIAEKLSENKKYEAAITAYKQIEIKHPASPFSAKALYSAGWHYENSLLRNDSAVAVYKRLIAKYPVSQYAAAARPKVLEYDNEAKRIEQEKQQALEAQKLKEQQEKDAKAAIEKIQEQAPAATDSLSTPKNKL